MNTQLPKTSRTISRLVAVALIAASVVALPVASAASEPAPEKCNSTISMNCSWVDARTGDVLYCTLWINSCIVGPI